MVTLKTIAAEAGVSTVTVSNVIHKRYGKVSPEKIELINAIIEKYNYVPNANARSLASKKSKIIGIVIPYVGDEENSLLSPYNMEIVGALEKEIRNRDYFTMIRTAGTVTEAIPVMKSWNVDGVIVLGASEGDVELAMKELSLPIVFVDSYSDCTHINVGVEDEKGGYLATRFLISNGHKKIWFVGPELSPEDNGVVGERYRGYLKALEQSNLLGEEKWVYAHKTEYNCGIEVGKTIAFEQDRPTAIFATSDIVALGITEGLRLSGLQVPEDISVVGFDNLPEGQYAYPKLTTVSQNLDKKAKMVAATLFDVLEKMDDEEIDLRKYNVDERIGVELIERNSVRSV